MTSAILYWPTEGIDLQQDNLGSANFVTLDIIETKSVKRFHIQKNELREKLQETESLIAALPQNLVAEHQLSLPKAQIRHLNKTIGFLLEEKLCTDISQQTFGYSNDKANGAVFTLAVSSRLVEQIVQFQAYCNIPNCSILSQGELILGTNKREIQSTKIEGSIHVNLPLIGRFSLPKSFEQHIKNQHPELFSPDNPNIIFDLANDPPILSSESPIEITEVHGERLLNLIKKCQNRSIPIIRHTIASANIWSLSKSGIYAIATVFLFLVLTSTYNFIVGTHYNSLSISIAQDSVNAYKEAFPNESQVFDIKRQLQGKLRHNGNLTENRLIGIMSALAQTSGELSNVNITSLKYIQNKHRATINIQAKNRQEILSYHQSIAKIADVNITSISESQGTFLATIVIH